jgi:hypothetical protein
MTRTTYAYWVRGREFAELAAKSIASIKRFEPFLIERRFLVVTDDEGADHQPPDWTDCFPAGTHFLSVDPGRPAMVANLDAQIRALHGTPMGERVIFLDADTLMLKAFPWTGADIHATWRADVNGDREMAKQQPWNYGVLGVNVTPATIEAFYWLRARILRMTPERQRWYGNQLALADLLGQPNGSHERRIRWTLEDEGTTLSVCELPCDTWNWTPNGPDESIDGKGIIHCKGDRKDLLEHYAARAGEQKPSTVVQISEADYLAANGSLMDARYFNMAYKHGWRK